jgi:hypothetical protein
MRRIAVVLLFGCSSTATPVERPPVANRMPPSAAPVPSRCATIDSKDAFALAEKTADTHAIDLDRDPATAESAVEHQCLSPLSCTYRIYALRDGCWVHLGETGDLMGEPRCDSGSAKGTYCTLSGMRLMIHGDAQEYLYPFHDAYGAEEPGTHYVPGPDKYP